MRKVIYFATAVFISMFISGCVSSGSLVKVPSSVQSKNLKEIRKISEDRYRFQGMYASTFNDSLSILEGVLHAAATFGLNNGYKYMALVTGNVNNLSGFPFNDWKNLKKYASLEPRIKGSGNYNPIVFNEEGLEQNNKPTIEVVYFKEAHPGVFLWDLRKLKRDTSH
jgi:hypothetical protein